MDEINVTFVHLHSPLFFARKNWGDKLDSTNIHRGKIEMIYNRKSQELMVKCDNQVIYIPSTNIISYVPAVEHNMHSLVKEGANVKAVDFPVPMPLQDRKKPGPKPKLEAQVSTPTSHVLAGEGAGKTNDR